MGNLPQVCVTSWRLGCLRPLGEKQEQNKIKKQTTGDWPRWTPNNLPAHFRPCLFPACLLPGKPACLLSPIPMRVFTPLFHCRLCLSVTTPLHQPPGKPACLPFLNTRQFTRLFHCQLSLLPTTSVSLRSQGVMSGSLLTTRISFS